MRRRHNLSRAISIGIAIVAFGLAAFHLSLLWHRLADASITQPGVIVRWIAGALVVGAMFATRGESRHRLVILWLLVALLHAGLPAERHASGTMPVAVVVQIGLTAACGVLLTTFAERVARDRSNSRKLEFVKAFRAAAIDLASLSGRSPPAV